MKTLGYFLKIKPIFVWGEGMVPTMGKQKWRNPPFLFALKLIFGHTGLGVKGVRDREKEVYVLFTMPKGSAGNWLGQICIHHIFSMSVSFLA